MQRVDTEWDQSTEAQQTNSRPLLKWSRKKKFMYPSYPFLHSKAQHIHLIHQQNKERVKKGTKSLLPLLVVQTSRWDRVGTLLQNRPEGRSADYNTFPVNRSVMVKHTYCLIAEVESGKSDKRYRTMLPSFSKDMIQSCAYVFNMLAKSRVRSCHKLQQHTWITTSVNMTIFCDLRWNVWVIFAIKAPYARIKGVIVLKRYPSGVCSRSCLDCVYDLQKSTELSSRMHTVNWIFWS